MKSTSNGPRNEIESTLLDYHRAPGKFALTRKQPALLFSFIREVLQLASGRSPDGQEAAPSAAVQQAACFFIRCALLSPNADHYALLGLTHSADTAAVKDRYRLMMRLMHPDFSSALSSANWPADAATRVNQAYEVLSSPPRRHSYDQRINPPAAPLRPASIEARPVASKAAAAKAPAQDRRLRLKWLAMAFGATGAIASLAMLHAGSNDAESLVQRATTRAASTIAAVALPQEDPRPRTRTAADSEGPVTRSMAAAPSLETIMQATPQLVANIPAAAVVPVLEIKKPPVLAPPSMPVRETSTTVAALPAAPVTFSPAVVVASVPVTAVVAAEPIARLAPAPALGPTTSLPAPTVPTPVPVAKPPPNPGVTLTQVHPLLSTLLQQMESGRGDQVLSLLDQDARGTPAAQALLRQYNVLVDGAGPVKLSNIQFKAEPREGHLLVTGHVLIQAGDAPPGSAAKQFSVQAEFVSRAGTVVMTRLARTQDN